MKPSDHADMEETLRALEVLRERKASSARFEALVRYVIISVAVLVGVPLGIVVFGGLIEGEIGFWPVLIALLYVGLLYLVYLAVRMIYPRNGVAISYLSNHVGYRKADREILDEQIADYEQRLEVLRRAEGDR